MIKLCVFDLDGTTVNSLPSIAHFANKTLEHFGYPPFPDDDYRHLAGGGAKVLWTNLVRETGAPAEMLDVMKEHWLRIYAEDFLYLSTSYEGITEMLSSLKEAGIITAIITNKDKRIADRICDTLFGSDGRLLDVCISDHPGMKLKPQPGEIFALMEHYGVRADECAYCGDHQIDMRMGKNAGVFTIGVTWGFHTRGMLLNAGADLVVDTPNELCDFIIRGEYNE